MEPDADELAHAGAALCSVASGIMDAAQISELVRDLGASNVLSPEKVRAGLATVILALGGTTPHLATLNELLVKLRERQVRPSGARSLNS